MVVALAADQLGLGLAADFCPQFVHVLDGKVVVDDHGRGRHGIQQADQPGDGVVYPLNDCAELEVDLLHIAAGGQLSLRHRLGQAVGLVEQRLEYAADIALEVNAHGQGQERHQGNGNPHYHFELRRGRICCLIGFYGPFFGKIHKFVQQAFGNAEGFFRNLHRVVGQLLVGNAIVPGAVGLAQGDGFQSVLFPCLPGRHEFIPQCRFFGSMGKLFIYLPGFFRPVQCSNDKPMHTFDSGHWQIGGVQAPLRRLDRGPCLADDQQVLDTRQTNHGDLLLKSHELVDAVVTEDAHGCRNNGHQTEAGDDFLS